MTKTTLSTVHANELIVVEGTLDPEGRASVTLGLVNQDRSDTFPGRTLSPDQADELAASLVSSAAAARESGGLAPAPRAEASVEAAGEQAPRTDDREELQALPIAEYDALKASAIVEQLPGLTAAQLSAVLTYERSHRNRKKVRARISELQADAAGSSR